MHEHQRTAVVALGGNALAPSGEASTIYDQFRHTRESLGPIVELALAGWSVCIVHGNGPQVGDELVRNEVARDQATPLPLGVLVAATAGWIGYMIQQSLENALRRAGSRRSVATVITQVQVDPGDPALRHPTKFIGRGLVKDVLSGTWLGHALHPMLTDIPIGSFTSGSLLDVFGGKRARPAAARQNTVASYGCLSHAGSPDRPWERLPRFARQMDCRSDPTHSRVVF